jgi:hypothetical protein
MMAQKKHPKTTAPAKKDERDKVIRLYEDYTRFTLLDALDGEFHIDTDTKAAAAFAVADVKTLTALVAKLDRDGDFIHPDVALAAGVKRMKPVKLPSGKTRKRTVQDLTFSDRISILREHPGTQANARTILDAQGSGTPFDE